MAKIFINYRRSSEYGVAEKLKMRLQRDFGSLHEFCLDTALVTGGDSIRPKLIRKLTSCDLLLVLIGKGWASELNHRLHSHRRDDVRVEISAASNRQIPIVPVCIESAPFPKHEDVEPHGWISDVGLDERHALNLRDASFDADSDELVRFLQREFGASGGYPSASAHRHSDHSSLPTLQIKWVTLEGAWLTAPALDCHEQIQLSPFEVSKAPLTNTQFDALRGNLPELPEPYLPQPHGWARPNAPVVGFTHAQACAIADACNARLPTLAEWYCCAGELLRLPWRSNPSSACEYGVFQGDASGRPVDVGTKQPNRLGLVDVIGNVNTWLAEEMVAGSGRRPAKEFAFIGGAYRDPPGRGVVEPQRLRAGQAPPFVGLRLVRSLAVNS